MLIKPFLLRVGVISDGPDRCVKLVNELFRMRLESLRTAKCSFYVPLLTGVAVVLFLEDTESGQREIVSPSMQRYKILLRDGPEVYEDEFVAQESSVRVYGGKASTTGFPGRNIDLIALEGKMEIIITNASTGLTVATFEYKHLQPSDAPPSINLGVADYSDESVLAPKQAQGTTVDGLIAGREPSRAAHIAAFAGDVDMDGVDRSCSPVEPASADATTATTTTTISPRPSRPSRFMSPAADSSLHVSIRGRSTSNLRAMRGGSPQKQTRLDSIFMPQLKADESDRHRKDVAKNGDTPVKSESSGSMPLPMPRIDPSPSLQLLKDSQRKVAGLEDQIEKAEEDLEGLADKRKAKVQKAQAAYERALVKADRDFDSEHARLTEHIEQARDKLEEEFKKQAWLHTKNMENIEVIEISDEEDELDSAEESDDQQERLGL